MSKPPYPRSRRLNAIVQEVLADQVERLTDPRLDLITITGVEVAPDMRRATVFVSAIDHERLGEAIAGLRAAAPRLRGAIGRQVRMKFTPDLDFTPDAGVVKGEQIDALLRGLTPTEETSEDD